MSMLKALTSWMKKESAAGISIAQFVAGQPVSTPRQYDKLVDEAYIKNVIAYRCVAMIAGACASVNWKLTDSEGKEIAKHPVLDLIAKPNPNRGGAYFIEELVSYLMLAGNAYVEKTALDGGVPKELYNLRPDRMTVIPAKNGMVSAYKHECNGVPITYPMDVLTGKGPICHLKKTHPLNDWYGLSPVEAVAYSVDQHNAASLHNTSLLQNSANPSGALILKGTVGTDDAKVDALGIALEAKYASPKRAGKPMVLSGDFDWKQFALSPKDLDFNTGKLLAAREICTGFGVPHELVVEGQSTYNNKAEAKLMLWEDTVIPLLYMLRDSFFSWLLEGYGNSKGLILQPDLNDVSALIPRREQHSLKVMREWTGGIITRDEARAQLGYDQTTKGKGGDEFYSSSPFPVAAASDGAAAKYTGPREIKALSDLTFLSDEIDHPEIVASITSLFREKIFDVVKIYGQSVVDEIGKVSSMQITSAVNDHIRETTAELVTQVNNTTKRLLKDTISEALDNRESLDDIRERVVEIFNGDISDYRSQMIAVTESTAATGFAAVAAMEQSGIEQKEWLAVIDGATRETHAAMDGQVVGVKEDFVSPDGDRADAPGGFSDAGNNINCRCTIAAVFSDNEKARTFDERRQLWEERDRKRQSAEKEIRALSRKIFIMQGEVVLERIDHLHQEPTFRDE